ncbi:hypothetical protein [Riemerella anatipestifer]|uniref:Uncharacterized protein n=2 Tax=Riemerella anatipestifer TaxID=34085 RepID=J9QZ53_RIEAN|nr:hypothetical protein [Riemerella anatipestifer]AFR35905.1 hypothetical protein B739_1307 [Riemerella anatipestifer RA-CH-1]AQY21433.1 hypothetical protein AB406_0475 [Riemerella anatipestifer]MCO7317793.1 hypothetical protein [Riemerella anatipestifer]MCU7560182.1 hypothetical protein [Riemerella anatipestifer]MCU7581584.1 hypothetical protein [Riemerella anatipestifer]
MGLLDERKTDVGVIEGRFIKAKLQQYGEDVLKSSKKHRRINRFSSSKWDTGSISVSDNAVDYRILAPMRFVDMKTRKSRGYTRGTRKIPGGKKKKKNYPVHNKPTMVHKKFLVKSLSFGFTEEVKQQFRALAEKEDFTKI